MHTGNATSHTSLSMIIKVCGHPFFCVFLCCIVIMLRIFATNRHFLDNSRYILFAYMLINDTLQLLSSVILFLLVIGLVTFPTVYCVPLLLLSTSTFMNTTLILATMSLERYVAIIYPLQCPAAWRSDRIWIIILSIWFLSFIFPMIEYSIGERDPAVDILSTPVLCKAIYINLSPIQNLSLLLKQRKPSVRGRLQNNLPVS
ncbi:Pyrokinin-1 receptor [Dissostichus eleginoides]|uniref:Pyrokinin-1 receptor n=2 Tax=Dissostichus eleginoides TaxID=100907 RepID=A0AAD9CCQ7_DISEL|nr:Pyrokinin-1 receptor [Dissostichus eleginoides]